MIHHAVPSGLDASMHARRFVRDDLAASLRSSKVVAGELMASELVTNAVQHAGLLDGDLIGIDIDVDPMTVRVSVVDGGPGMDPDRPISAKEAGGWGLVLIDRISDRWGIRRTHPHSIWFEIDR